MSLLKSLYPIWFKWGVLYLVTHNHILIGSDICYGLCLTWSPIDDILCYLIGSENVSPTRFDIECLHYLSSSVCFLCPYVIFWLGLMTCLLMHFFLHFCCTKFEHLIIFPSVSWMMSCIMTLTLQDGRIMLWYHCNVPISKHMRKILYS